MLACRRRVVLAVYGLTQDHGARVSGVERGSPADATGLRDGDGPIGLDGVGVRPIVTRPETRASADGKEQWLNWVVRVPSGALIGYVQATLYGHASAAIAYELNSAHWGRGLASLAVAAMIEELAGPYRVRRLSAVLKRENRRSQRLLERLGFTLASPALHARQRIEPDEMLMTRRMQAV